MPGTLTDADIAAHETQAPATLTDADIAAHEPSDPFGTMTPEEYSKLNPGEQHFRQGFAQFAKDHPHIFSVIKDAYLTPPGGEMSVPGVSSASIPARDILNATSAFFKAGGRDMAVGGVKAAGGAALAHMGPLGEFGNAIAGGGLFTKGAKQIGRGIKAGFGAARETFSTPEAEALDTSALPVHGGVENTPTDPLMGRIKQSMADIQAQPETNMDETLASMKKQVGARDIPASQDRYDVGSGAPLMKPRAKAAKATAGGSLEDQLSASVEKARASKPAGPAQSAPANENYKPGDTVWLPNRGMHVLVTKINGDGTFEYTTGK